MNLRNLRPSPLLLPVFLAAIALSTGPLPAAPAHDFWIEPSAFRSTTPGPLKVGLQVGDFGRGEAVPRDGSRIVHFLAQRAGAGAAGRKPVLGLDGQVPAGAVRLDADGLWILGYRSHPKHLELDADKFEAYLAEAGLESIRKLRAERGESQRPARELYSRCAKALVQVGEADLQEQTLMEPLGFELELLPESNPFAAAAAEPAAEPTSFAMRLVFEGKPLEGALVRAYRLDGAAESAAGSAARAGAGLALRTDAQGRVRFALPVRGRWLFASVHMRACADPTRADWESLWASLALELSAGPAPER